MRIKPTKRILSRDPERAASDLTACPLFREVEPELIKRLAASSQYVECEPDHVFVINGDTQPSLTILQTGAARIQCTSRDFSRIIIIGYLFPGSPIGEINLLDGSTHTADVVAVRLTTALELNHETFQSVRSASRFLYRNLALTLAKKIRLNNRRTMNREESQFNSISEIALAIEEQIDVHGFIDNTRVIACKITHDLLSELTSIDRSTVSTVIAKLVNSGVIANPRAQIEILDRNTLREYITLPPRD